MKEYYQFKARWGFCQFIMLSPWVLYPALFNASMLDHGVSGLQLLPV